MGRMNKQYLGMESDWLHPCLAMLAGAFCIAFLECFSVEVKGLLQHLISAL